ncbi:hypothetical protein RHMOL_Rhmol10G0198600 [Rhododendron molle]|uniref:Uncharacterized protein n=1 Tax=Rhododendron molle TaxID=49168 RepID=A0ACC0M4Q4_RHOML|nr:hypothetical protein RHMOL_Rhmol10G0198600 [Rhododendron molle]
MGVSGKGEGAFPWLAWGKDSKMKKEDLGLDSVVLCVGSFGGTRIGGILMI